MKFYETPSECINKIMTKLYVSPPNNKFFDKLKEEVIVSYWRLFKIQKVKRCLLLIQMRCLICVTFFFQCANSIGRVLNSENQGLSKGN
jgi:hypothetical protein